MADNVTIDIMSGGDAIAADDISGIKFQRIKLIHGADGTNDGDVSTANPLPVRLYIGTDSVVGGAGAVAAGVQRVTLASNDPAVTQLTAIAGYVDGIEGYVDGIEGLLTTIDADTGNIATSLAIIDDWDDGADSAKVVGSVAHDTADAGAPVKIGHKAVAHGSNPAAVAAADRVDSIANRHGIPFVIGGHPNILTASINVTDADGAQTNAAIITVGAGTKIVVTHIAVTADNANTADVGVRIGFGTANTPAADAAGLIIDHPGIAKGGGMVVGNGAGIIGIGGDNEDLRITCEDPAGGSISVVVGYYTIES